LLRQRTQGCVTAGFVFKSLILVTMTALFAPQFHFYVIEAHDDVPYSCASLGKAMRGNLIATRERRHSAHHHLSALVYQRTWTSAFTSACRCPLIKSTP